VLDRGVLAGIHSYAGISILGDLTVLNSDPRPAGTVYQGVTFLKLLRRARVIEQGAKHFHALFYILKVKIWLSEIGHRKIIQPF
jgi:hypothetical protein